MRLKEVLVLSYSEIIAEQTFIILAVKDVMPAVYKHAKEKHWTDLKTVLYILECSWSKVTCGHFLNAYLRYKKFGAFS